MKSRRQLLALGLSLLVASPRVSGQSTPALRRIGVLDPSADDAVPYRAFPQALRELGYIDGKNVVVEGRFARGIIERLPALAEELAARHVELIVAQSTPAVLAARRANPSIPIVMVAVGDPVSDGLVASLARPGGLVTGTSILASEIGPKSLEMLKAALPDLARVAVLINSANPNHSVSLKNIQAAAQRLKVTVVTVEAASPSDIGAAFKKMERERVAALVAPGDAFFRVHAGELAKQALRHRLPSAFSNKEIAEAGGLLSYGANIADSYRRAAVYVDKILKGTKPADLPVEQAARFELVVNLKTAKALGITIPQSILVRADRVIE